VAQGVGPKFKPQYCKEKKRMEDQPGVKCLLQCFLPSSHTVPIPRGQQQCLAVSPDSILSFLRAREGASHHKEGGQAQKTDMHTLGLVLMVPCAFPALAIHLLLNFSSSRALCCSH
jgi:hypothetical protein